ncbi:MAG: ABC transporter permease [Alphaproteobacteria bacterium]|nr:ABC transporter permease [Alphaproteobacteria bacterium]
MTALLHLTLLGLKLNFRNRMAILYGYLFPLIFLVAFWAVYRGDPVPLALHVGQFLTVTILGSACFGLPTTIVSERERGVWRRYRLLPAPGWVFLTSVLLARAMLLVTAALLQLALAFAFGMPAPTHPLGLFAAFAMASFAFLGVGLVIAMLVDNVPAVQALGQCIFLPMLIIGGVAVRLESLPNWAQHVSLFAPARYAVEALQLSATGAGLSRAGFDLAALLLIGAAGAVAAGAMFRWDRAFIPRRAWLLLAVGMWVAVGVAAETRGRATVSAVSDTREVGTARDYVAAAPKPQTASASWKDVTQSDIDGIDFKRLPADEGIIAPLSRGDEAPDPAILPTLDRIRDAMPGWAPGTVSDPVQRARNLLGIAAVPDILQMEQVERFVPRLVFARLQAVIPPRDLPKILYWIALHPDDGSDAAMHQLDAFGLPDITGPTRPVRGRVMLYAFKLLGRLAGPLPNN